MYLIVRRCRIVKILIGVEVCVMVMAVFEYTKSLQNQASVLVLRVMLAIKYTGQTYEFLPNHTGT